MDILDSVLNANNPTLLFGKDKAGARISFRKLARAVHPDLFETAQKDRATKAFARLSELWNSYSVNETVSTPGAGTIRTRRHEYVIGEALLADDIITRYSATYDDGHENVELLIANSVKDSDLLEAYASSLRILDDVPEQYRIYFPTLIERFRYRQSDGDHAGLAMTPLNGFYTLTQVLEDFPMGLDGRDVAWIFRRMLVALGNAHELGLVHGAPDLDAFSILPGQHGVVLNNWQYSVKTGEVLKAIPAKNRKMYPAYALAKETVTSKLDISVASSTAEALLSANNPPQLKRFLNGCRLRSTPPADQLLAEFDGLLDEVYGKRSFHPFIMKRETK